MMNTPVHTPGAFLGGGGAFPSSSGAYGSILGSGPGPSWLCLPIDQDTLAFGTDTTTAPEAPAGPEENDADITKVPAQPTSSSSPASQQPTLQLVSSSMQSKLLSPENMRGPSSPNCREYLFTMPARKSGGGSSSEDEQDDDGCSSSGDEGNYHDHLGYYFAPPKNRREPQTAGGTDRSLSAITNCPISISWLKANFEYAPGKSLPRGFVYDQYVVLCEEHTLEPVNAASFGKLIRCVFPGLKTRRLGTRGNSKYHYNGVYLKKESVLHALLNHVKTQQGLTYDATGKRGRKMKGPKTWHAAGQPKQKIERIIEPQELTPEEYLGHKPNMDRAFVEMSVGADASELRAGVTLEDISTFQFLYHEHCKTLVSCFSTVDVKAVRREWKQFWRIKLSASEEECIALPGTSASNIPYKAVMSKATLFKVCTLEATHSYVRTMDLWTYQLVLDILFPCFADVMPLQMLHSLESFITSCTEFLTRCLNGYPVPLCQAKIQTLLTFIVSWSESASLNRMVKTVSTSLRHEDSLKAMRSELGRALNFPRLEVDLSRVLSPNGFALVVECILDFKRRLEDTQDQTIGAWLTWIESLVQKLQAEADRQEREKERINKPNPIKFWRMASDKILGAVMRGTAVSSGVFRTLLIFCDSFVASIHSTYAARMMGYHLQTFYLHHKHFPEPAAKMEVHEVEVVNIITEQPTSPPPQNLETEPDKLVDADSKVEEETEQETYETELLGIPHGEEIIALENSGPKEIIMKEVEQVIEVEEMKEDRFPTEAELGLTGDEDEDRRVIVTLADDGEGPQEIVLEYDMLFDPITAEFLEDHGVCKSSVRRAY